MIQIDKDDARRFSILLASAFVIGPAALWVHDFMLVGLKIPGPIARNHNLWYDYLNRFVEVISVFYFCRATALRFRQISTFAACAICGALCVMMHEVLRNIVIDTFLSDHGWTKGAYLFIVAGSTPALLSWLFYGCVVYLTADKVARFWRIPALVAITAVGLFAVEPALGVFSLLLKEQAHLFDRPQKYFSPYPLKIYLVIYLTFAETALAAIAVTALSWRGLAGSPWRRIAIITAIILGIRGEWFSLLFGGLTSAQPFLVALASESQFFLETLVVGLLSGLMYWTLTKSSVEG